MQLKCNYFALKEGVTLKSNREIGNRIKLIRISVGKNQEDFGYSFDPPINKSSISRWESGKTMPSSRRLREIAEIGGVSVEYLLNGNSLSKDEQILLLDKSIHDEKNLDETERSQLKGIYFDAMYRSLIGKTFDAKVKEERRKLKKELDDFNNLLSAKRSLNPDLIRTLAYFLETLNLITELGTQGQYLDFITMTHLIRFIAIGEAKYDKKDFLPNVDKLLSSFPIKKDDSDESK